MVKSFRSALLILLLLGIFVLSTLGTSQTRLEKRSSHRALLHGGISDLVHGKISSVLGLLHHHRHLRLKRSSHGPLRHLRRLLHRDKRNLDLEIHSRVLHRLRRLRNPGEDSLRRLHRLRNGDSCSCYQRIRRSPDLGRVLSGRIHSSHMHGLLRGNGRGMHNGMMIHSSHFHRLGRLSGLERRLSRRSILEGYAAYRMGKYLEQRAKDNGGVEGIPYVLVPENSDEIRSRRKRTSAHLLNWIFNGNNPVEPEKWYEGRYYYQPIRSEITGLPCSCCVEEPQDCVEEVEKVEEPPCVEEPQREELFVEPPEEEEVYEEPPSEEYQVPGFEEEEIEFQEYPELPKTEEPEFGELPEEENEPGVLEVEEKVPVVQIG